MLERLQRLNPGLSLEDVESPAFRAYGRIVEGFDLGSLMDRARSLPVPTDTNTYTAELPGTRDTPLYENLSRRLYGGMPIQIGFGGGFNLGLNALEWHQGNEVAVAVTDFVLMLATLPEVEEGRLDTSRVRTFYARAGQAVELYGTTLHYSPCNVDSGTFRMLVVLPRGTNLPLEGRRPGDLLAARNKWLIAHPEARKEVEEGAAVGLTGPNLHLAV